MRSCFVGLGSVGDGRGGKVVAIAIRTIIAQVLGECVVHVEGQAVAHALVEDDLQRVGKLKLPTLPKVSLTPLYCGKGVSIWPWWPCC